MQAEQRVESQARDLADFLEAAREFGVARAADARCELGEDLLPASALDRHHERKAELLAIGRVGRAQTRELVGRAAIEAGGRLFAHRIGGQRSRRPLPCRRAPGARRSARASLRATRAQGPRASRDAARRRCEMAVPRTRARRSRGCARKCRPARGRTRRAGRPTATRGWGAPSPSLRASGVCGEWMARRPVPGDVDAPRHPHAVVRLDVIEEPLQRDEATGTAEQPAVHADRHHARRFGALRVEHVERVAQVGEEVIRGYIGVAVRRIACRSRRACRGRRDAGSSRPPCVRTTVQNGRSSP